VRRHGAWQTTDVRYSNLTDIEEKFLFGRSVAAITKWERLHLKWSTLSQNLDIVIKESIQVMNFIQVRLLNNRMF
jgi:arabinogalactan endo-1,4-beta-galactosidase